MAQPAIKRFEWETKSATYALKQLGVNKEDIILLFSYVDYYSNNVVNELEKYGATTYLYADERTSEEKAYIPTLKPYLMYKYFSSVNDTDTYLYMDSDVLILDNLFTTMLAPDKHNWIGSNVGGYLNYDYIVGCENGEQILNEMANIVGVSPDWVKEINHNAIGAQYLINGVNPEYFHKVYKDSAILWSYIKDKDTNYQKWCQEMVATLWNMNVFDINPISEDAMTFSWSTDPYELTKSTSILHNAGIVDDSGKEFFKGIYVDSYPTPEQLTISSGNASDYYAKITKRALYS